MVFVSHNFILVIISRVELVLKVVFNSQGTLQTFLLEIILVETVLVIGRLPAFTVLPSFPITIIVLVLLPKLLVVFYILLLNLRFLYLDQVFVLSDLKNSSICFGILNFF